MKKIGPCKVIRKFGANAYEIELHKEIRISPIFNVVDLYPYRDGEAGAEEKKTEVQWTEQMPIAKKT